MRDQLLQGFWLGQLRIDPVTGTVTGDGPPEHLPSRAVEVLLCLAHTPGELVSRAELLAAVWGDGQGSEEALSHAVSELRHGLGDHASEPVFVQTLPRRGYRLLVEPRLDTEAARVADPAAPPFWRELLQRGVVQAGAAYLVVGWLLIQVAGETFDNLRLPAWAIPAMTYVVVAGFPIALLLAWFLEFAGGRLHIDRGGRRRRGALEGNYLAVVAAYALATLGVGAFHLTFGIPVPEVAGTPAAGVERDLPVEPNSVAVLRFRTQGDSRARLFGDGLAEDVLDRLSRVPGIAVSSRTDAWSLPDGATSADVRRRLRVAHYLEGGVRLEGDDLRVTVQLIDTQNGFQEFSRTFPRQLSDFMQLQQEITRLVVANLRVALEAETEQWLDEGNADTDPDAYVLYRRGREIFELPRTSESLSQATEYFAQALDIDPGYAAAHAGLCSGYVELYVVTSDTERIDDAERSCATALISNPNLYMVYSAMGDLYRRTNRLFLAEKAYRNALERNAKDLRSMTGLAEVYQQQNRPDQAVALLETASGIQPGNWRVINATGTFHFASGEFDEAADAFRKVAYLDPENWQAQGNLGSALLMTGRFEDAADALVRALEIHPDQGSLSNLGIVYYYLGEYPQAVATYRRALERSPRSHIAWLNLGDALHFAGEPDAAREAYVRAAELSEERLAVNAGETETIEALAWASSMLGQADRARRLAEQAIELAPNDPYAWYYAALVRQRSGDVDGALDAIARALDEGYSSVMLQAEPLLRDLKRQERFARVLASNGKR